MRNPVYTAPEMQRLTKERIAALIEEWKDWAMGYCLYAMSNGDTGWTYSFGPHELSRAMAGRDWLVGLGYDARLVDGVLHVSWKPDVGNLYREALNNAR